MKTKLIYLASPYSHKYKRVMKQREQTINRIGAYLSYTTGQAIYPPITVSAVYARLHKFESSFEAWKDVDLCVVSKCDEVWVVMLKGWETSIGVLAEIRHAQKLKKKIKYYDPEKQAFTKVRNV